MTESARVLVCRVWFTPDTGDSYDVSYPDIWSVSSGKSGKLYVDFGPEVMDTSSIVILEPDRWYRYEIVKTEKREQST